ncbi:FUSC family protein [Citricoccus muralis]|uniref:FUSC family protein n=1 Tax=Citricoccus muralis TaxID=169134 RepID=A0ABY8H8A1_9MICC|nr:FUSC family protein [Citricoccus muralis]WFP17141.1 FUSC family protein [Citricoccus muralis]
MALRSLTNPLPSLFTIGPADRDHEAGVRCAITVLVPLLTLLAIDRIDLSIFACFGAFTAIYGRNLDHAARFQMQARAGGLMLAVLLLATLAGRVGISEAQNPWLLVACTTAVAGVASVIAAHWRLRPSGSLFQIFAFAAVASIPVQPAWWEAMATSCATVGFALAVGLVSRVLRSHRTPLYWPRTEALSEDHRKIILGEGVWYLVAAGAAGTVATALGAALGISHNYWAMVAAVVPLVGHSTRYRVSRGLQRVIGTFLGLLVLAAVLALEPALWVLVLLIAALQFTAEMFIARQYMIAQAVVTPLALLATVLATSAHTGALPTGAEATALMYDRAMETVIGSGIGVMCVLFPWAWRRYVKRTAEPERSVGPSVRG